MWQPKHSPDLLLVDRMTMFEYGAQIVEGKSHRILIRVDTFGEVARFPQSSLQEDQMSSQFVPFLFPCRLSPLRHSSRLLRWMQTAPVRRLGGTFPRLRQRFTVQRSSIRLSVVVDSDIQGGKESPSQREYLRGLNHHIPKVFAALDF